MRNLETQNRQIRSGVLATCIVLLNAIVVAFAISIILLVDSSKPIFAATSDTVSFQGKIVRNDTGSEGINVDSTSTSCIVSGADTCQFKASYYDDSVGTTLLGSETFSNIELGDNDGVFNLLFGTKSFTAGAVSSFEGIFSGGYDDVYVKVEFAPDGSSFTESFGLMGMRAAPYAMNSKYLGGLDVDGFLQLGPSVIQENITANTSIFVNNTGGGDLLNLQISGSSALFIGNNGNVGIGTTTPSGKLDINGRVYINGEQSLYNAYALDSLIGSLFIGNGGQSLSHTVDDEGYYNTGLGIYALYTNTTGYNNTALGSRALRYNETGSHNMAVGSYALFNTTASYNTGIGSNALYSNTNGHHNLAIGAYAMQSNIVGYYNVAIGPNALYSNTNGYSNVAIGVNAGRYITDGTTANESSNNSIYLGSSAKSLASGDTNEIVIGSDTTGLGSNSVVLGNDSIANTILRGNVGIGTTTPDYKLQIDGDVVSETDSTDNLGNSAVYWANSYIDRIYLNATAYIDGVTTGNLTFTGNLSPSADDTYTLGSSSARWKDLYLGSESIHIGSSSTDEGVFSYDTSNNIFEFNTDTTTNGDIAFLTDDLYLDKSTGRVGIGTASPTYHLTTATTGATDMISTMTYSNSGLPGGVVIRKYRGTEASPSAAQTGDRTGGLWFQSYDGTSVGTTAVIKSASDGTVSTGSLPGNLTFATSPSGSIAAIERMRIDSTGRVGIGTASPTYHLTTATTGASDYIGTMTYMDAANGGGFVMRKYRGTESSPSAAQTNDIVGSIWFQSYDGTSVGTPAMIRSTIDGTVSTGSLPGNLVFTTASSGSLTVSERMRINSSGNIGINDSTPSYKLDVNGTLRAYGITDSSDIRLKKDITNISPTLDKVLQLQGINYHWIDSQYGSDYQTGFIAQDVELLFPNLVSTDDEGYKSIAYSKFSAVLAEAIQEQQIQIEDTSTLYDSNIKISEILTSIEDSNTHITDLETSITDLENTVAQLDQGAGLGYWEYTEFSINTEKPIYTPSVYANDGVFASLTSNMLNTGLGLFTVDSLGNVIAKGDVYLESMVYGLNGVVTFADGIFAPSVTTNILNVNNDLGESSYSIDETGKVTISADNEDATLGTSSVLTGETVVTVFSTQIQANSKVFVTVKVTEGGEIPGIAVTNVMDGSFDVVLDGLYLDDVLFDWWIVDPVEVVVPDEPVVE